MGTGGKVAVVVLALVAAGVLFFVLREGDESTDATKAPTDATTTEQQADGAGNVPGGGGGDNGKPDKPKPDKPKIATIEVRGGQPVGGVQELSFTQGERIQFIVRADVADEVHLHGYDVTKEVPAGGEAAFDVPATIDGVFEAELHHSLAPIAEITVQPG